MSDYTPITTQGHATWQQAAAAFVADLDRCEHGRHAIDPCFGCPGGQSAGNPRAIGWDPRLPDGRSILGYTVHGTHVYVLDTPALPGDGKPLVVTLGAPTTPPRR